MALRRLAFWLGLCSVCALAQTTFTVGQGLTADIQATFVTAYSRGSFSSLVGSPTGVVENFGASGLIQLFPGATVKTQFWALVKPDSTTTANVMQVWNPMYNFFIGLGVNVTGFPTADTASCPFLTSTIGYGNYCTWQPFANDYGLFLYNQSIADQNPTILLLDPFFTAWNGLGGNSVLGPPETMAVQVQGPYQSNAAKQIFDLGAMYNMSAGPANGQMLTVLQPIYGLYASNGAEQGPMGLPLTQAILLPNGMRQQAFERGAIEYNPTTLATTQLAAVGTVTVSAGTFATGNSVQMYATETLTLQSTLTGKDGTALVDRPITWTSSNPAVVQINGSGTSVTLQARAYGAASITATAEGQTSTPLTVTVSATYCCQIGQGSPTASIQAALQDAISRSGLSLTAVSGVTRIGSGYEQQLVNGSGTAYLVCVADSAGAAYIVTGAILAQYQLLGGPAGALGYPLAAVTVGGRQSFQNGALAGSPVQLVSGAILTTWQAMGYETGAAGSPSAAAATFATFRGATGNQQSFQNGAIYAATVGTLAGQGFFVSGPILTTYTAGGGPSGNLGAPIGPQVLTSGALQQNFEGGNITVAAGVTTAVEHDNPRTPLITATPSAVRIGSPVHLVIGGFSNNATVKVTQTGQAAFTVTVPSGAYTFDSLVPSTATAGTISVTATDSTSGATAQASYSIYSLSTSQMTITAVSGDQQSGAPGAVLPQPMVVAVKDQNGNPVQGQTVAFTASPGAQALPSTVVTDVNGYASASLYLPASAGIALATATVGSKFVTFSAQSASFSLGHFPALTQAVNGTLGNGSDTLQNKGALLTAVAGIVNYYQSLGELPQTNGVATPASLNQFLSTYCTTDFNGNPVCDGFVELGSSPEQTVNLWRVGAFVGDSLTVQLEPVAQIANLVAGGSPVLVALSLGSLGSHFVVAYGVNADGTVQIADPNPAFAQTNLSGYLGGFSANGETVQGTITGAAVLSPQTPATPGFLVASNAAVTVTSASGSCGPALTFPGVAAVAGIAPASAVGTLYFVACSGAAGTYELDAGPGAYNLTVTDLAANGARTFSSGTTSAAYAILSSGQHWSLTPLTTVIAGSVVNAASYTSAIAPGGLISIFGEGFAGSTTVQMNGNAAKVVAVTPFQVNAQVPYTIAPGTVQLTLGSASGSAQQQVAISAVAPAIFSISTSQAAITNLNNSLNTSSNPAARGSYLIIYATGLGAVTSTGVATTPVSVVIGGVTIPAAYAGTSAGGTGLNQINVLLPATMPPGLALPLYLKQGSAVSNTVSVAIQ